MAFTETQAKALAEQARIFREAADGNDHSHNDLVKWLSDELQDCYPAGCGQWCYFVDFVGDAQSGMVQYCCGGDLTQAPYTIDTDGDKVSVTIDTDSCEDILAVTQYMPEGEMNNPAMEGKRFYTRAGMPLYERNIPQSSRNKMDSGSFAGKGKSFPISKPEDVSAAVHSLGRAGPDNYDKATIKSNIKRIAKKKGFPLPDSMKDSATPAREAGARHSAADQQLVQDIHDTSLKLGAKSPAPDAKESFNSLLDKLHLPTTESKALLDLHEADPKKAAQSMHDQAVTKGNKKQHAVSMKLGAKCPDDCKMAGGSDDDTDTDEAAAVDLVGDVISLREGAVAGDGTALLKLIAPGWGSSGYYPAAVLERDGPKVFSKDTKNFWDHQTAAEESARPEGSLRDLASVLTEDAHYEKNGPAGEGLYAKAKVFEQFRAPVNNLAQHIGMSIRATGKAKEGKAPDGKSGKIIEQLTSGVSVDYVTTPGAGGAILQLFEAARGRASNPNPQQEQSMTEAEQKELREAKEAATAATAESRKLKERFATIDASTALSGYFRTIRVGQGVQERVTNRILAGSLPLTEAGELDTKKLTEFAEAAVKDELDYLKRLNPGLVRGMTAPGVTVQATEAQQKEAKKANKKAVKEADRQFANVMGFGSDMHKIGRRILREGRGQFDVNYNARHKGAVLPGAGETMQVGG